MVLERLDGRLCDQDVDLSLNSIEGNRVVRSVGREDSDCVAGGEGVNGGLVGFSVARVIRGVGGEARV